MVVDQKEHLVPQVYLKQWACEDSITILDCKSGEFKKVQVFEYNRKLNFYDIGWHEPNLAKHNENEFCRLESEYLKFLNSVASQKGLIQEKWQAYCDRLVALMFVRTESYWNVFNFILKHPKGREKLLNEIYFDMPLYLNVQKIALEMFPSTEPINIVLCDIARNVQSKLQYFNQIILRTNPKERPFITSTNPVLMFSNSSDTSTFFHLTSEIYLPLSPEYCLYMFHPKHCSSNNKLQDFPNGRISEATPDFVWDMCTKLKLFSGSSEFIMPQGIVPSELKKLDRDELSKLDSEFGGFYKSLIHQD